MSYAPLANRLQALEIRTGIWYTLVGFLLIGLGYVVLLLAMIAAAGVVMGQEWAQDLFFGQATPPHMLFLLATFLSAMPVLFLVSRVFHKHKTRDHIGPKHSVIKNFLRATCVAGLVIGPIMLIAAWFDAPVPQMAFWAWVLYLPLALPLLLIQAGTEELIFRGYLQNHLIKMGAHPAVWLILPSVLFGLMHYDPETLQGAAPLVVIWATIFGLLAADLTARTGNLGAAVGFHFANNFFAMFVVTLQGHLDGLSLWVTPYSVKDTEILISMMPLDLALMLLMYAALRFAFRPQP